MFVAAALALSLCCGGSVSGSVAPTQNALVAQYKVALPPRSTAFVEFGPDTRYGFRTSTVSATAPVVSIFVGGMKQNSTYHMRAVITHANGARQVDVDHVFHTGAAPAGRIPVMTVTRSSALTPSPGVELVCVNPLPNNPGNFLRVMAVNPAGDLIWYYDFDPELGTAQPIKLLPNSNFPMVLFGGTTGPGGMVREIDLAGHTVHEFTVERLNQWLAAAGYTLHANAIHHDIVGLPNGHLLVMVNTHKQFTNLPGYPGVTRVLGDAIVDLDANYKPVWVWSSFDHLDVNRHPMMFPDWTHANTILYSPKDGNIVLSVRHQSWILKIDYANGHGTGGVVWRLGYQGDFTLRDSTSPADWFFAQHYASFTDSRTTGDFRLAVFDNGNNRYPDFSGTICPSNAGEVQHRWAAMFGVHVPACYSRPALLGVNEDSRTAQLLWSYVVPYSYWGGVNMELPNHNMFFDDTSTSDRADGLVETQDQGRMRIIIEGLAILCLVLWIFVGPVPTAVIPFLIIPIAIIVVFAPVLGGIAVAIGLLVDGFVLVMGQEHGKLEHGNGEVRRGLRGALLPAVKRVNRPSFFALAAIAISFLPMFRPVDNPSARIMEVTQKEPPLFVWELDVNGQESYRTVHLPSLYPDVQW